MSLPPNAVGPGAVTCVFDPLQGPPSGERFGEGELTIIAQGLEQADLCTALAIRANIEQHLAANRGAKACLWNPLETLVNRRLCALLGSLPSRCTGGDATAVDPRAIVPVTQIAGKPEMTALARSINVAGASARLGNLRMSRSVAFLVSVAAADLLANALSHGGDAGCAPFTALGIDDGSRDVNLAVFDLGTSVSSSADPVAAMEDALATSERTQGGLVELPQHLAEQELDVSMVLRSGSALATWAGSWQVQEVGASPGWLAQISVHRG